MRDGEFDEGQIREYYSGLAEGENWRYMASDAIFARAVALLREYGVIDAIEDDFGPSIIRLRAHDFHDGWNALAALTDLPFENYNRLRNGGPWILRALGKLVTAYQDLEISEADFAVEEAWSAIPLDRDNPRLTRAIASVDRAAADVEASNGYAVAHPQERQFILAALSTLQKVLREHSHTSAEFLRRFGYEPLARVAVRFKGAATGIAALAATEALKDWVREVVTELWHLR